MSQCHEEEKDIDQLLDLSNALLTITGKGLHAEVCRKQYFVEVEDTNELYVVRFLVVATDCASGGYYDTKCIRHEKRTPEVLVGSVFWCDYLPDNIHSIHVNEKSAGPECLYKQVKCFPIDG